MIAGQRVKVQAYGGEVLTRVVVTQVGDIVYVCREIEYGAALEVGTEPKSVGFNKCFVTDFSPLS